jgi:hypothetical protein
MKRAISISKDLANKAKDVLSRKESARAIIQEFIKEMADINIQAAKTWEEIKEELYQEGVIMAQNEIITYDFVKEEFFIEKQNKE